MTSPDIFLLKVFVMNLFVTITKWTKYYKVGPQVLVITKWDHYCHKVGSVVLLQSGTTLLQCATGITKWSLTPFSKSLMVRDGLLKKLSKKMVQYVSSRHSIKARTTLDSRISSLFSFLPKYKSNWNRYPIWLASWYKNLNPHFTGLFFTYYLMLDLPLSLTMCSSTLWVEPLVAQAKKLSLKWLITDLT